MQEVKNLCAICLIKFKCIWIKFGMLSRLVGLMTLILILCSPVSIQGRESNLDDFV